MLLAWWPEACGWWASLWVLQSEQAAIEEALQTAREEVCAWEAICFREQEDGR